MINLWTEWRRRLEIAASALMSLAVPAVAAPCERVEYDGCGYVVCTVDAGRADDLRLWPGPADFTSVRAQLDPGEALAFAMNAGMFHADYNPVGLLVIDGQSAGRLITGGGGGNFGLLPNGVFCVGENRLSVIETRAFAERPPTCRLATQSGPMLVIDGELHPRFLPNSDSRYIRNGVGVSADGQTAWFAISDRPVTFHEFGSFFRDGLGAPQALYLDGSISRLYAPSLGRADWGRRMGPVIGLVDAVPRAQ